MDPEGLSKERIEAIARITNNSSLLREAASLLDRVAVLKIEAIVKEKPSRDVVSAQMLAKVVAGLELTVKDLKQIH